ncbi:glycosyltransferase family 2 protein [Photobacterium profundum]|uniref:glycosyltransferase family 2 protein n=1 Tax=Photobacterium profundum TaxID=74109 RepID=UPI003D101645
MIENNVVQVEVLLSTLNDGLDGISINENYHYLIIHQITNGKNEQYDLLFREKIASDKVRYIQSSTIGLSKSRNIALEHAVGDILWIMDDDTKLLDSAYNSIVDEFGLSKKVVILNFMPNFDLVNDEIKEYKFNYISAIHICSINICIRKDVVNDGFRFDESFGLGTQLPSGEEYIFITDMIKNGYDIFQSKIIGCLHSDDSSGLDFFSSENKLIAKFRMFERVFGKAGFIFSLLFLMKKSNVLYRHGYILKSYKLFFRHILSRVIS